MDTTNEKKTGRIRAALQPLLIAGPDILLFEILYKLLSYFVLKPVLSGILDFSLQITGFQIAFNNSIWEFFLTLEGIITALILIILSAICVYFEFAVLILLTYYAEQDIRIPLFAVIRRALPTLKSLRSIGFFGFALYALGLLPVINMGISSSLLLQISIPNFIGGELMKSWWGGYLLTGVFLLFMLLFFYMVFTLPIMVIEGKKFGRTIKENFHLQRATGWKMIGIYASFFLLWTVLYFGPLMIFESIFQTRDVTVGLIWSAFGFSWQGILLLVLLGITFLLHTFLMPLLLTFVVKKYLQIRGTEHAVLPPVDVDAAYREFNPLKLAFIQNLVRRVWDRIRQKKWTRRLAKAVAVVLVLTLAWGVFEIFHKAPSLHSPIVLGHRGSLEGVENTVEAIQGAIDAGADYTEADILLSKDGIPVVIHDTNLNRLAGKDVNVYDLTAAQLGEITLTQDTYTGKISTLEEVIQLCQGKIGLALELKLHGQEKLDIVEVTMDLLQKYDYAEDCMFVSMEYDLIDDINTRYPKSNAGFCIYGNAGELKPDVLDTMNIDFVVIEEWMVTTENLRNFRGAWLPVYVWTVNDTDSMEKYLDMGVLGLTTDVPKAAVEVVQAHRQRSDIIYWDRSDWEG